MRRGDAPDKAGGANEHPDDNTWLRHFFEWVLSGDFAHAHATYLIEQQRSKLEQRRQWDREAAEVRAYALSIEAVPPDPIATQLLIDMNRLENEGRVVWNDWTRNWEKPRPRAVKYPYRDPLTADALLSRFTKVRKLRAGWQATCPAHKDRHPSLSIRRGDRWWLTYCHAGCSTRAICAAVGLTVADLALERSSDG
jgi:hypothetical protein